MEAEGDQDGSEGSNSESDEDVIKVDFKSKQKSNSGQKKDTQGGIMGLKFMQRAEANKKEQLKE